MTFYDFATATVRTISRLVWRTRVHGLENIPLHGPLIIACNHVSNIDPPVMGCWVPRRLSYMAKKELFAIPGLGALITALGAYPVDRHGSATAAIKRSVEILRAQGCVGIFPEGGRNVTGDREARAGVALLASLGKAPVVPACIVGSDRAVRLHRIDVVFGPPIALPADRKATRDDLAAFTEQIMAAIAALAKEYGRRTD